jgi:hypothetical protein
LSLSATTLQVRRALSNAASVTSLVSLGRR